MYTSKLYYYTIDAEMGATHKLVIKYIVYSILQLQENEAWRKKYIKPV